MSKTIQEEVINRATGLLIIDVINSNPNGDPDKESDPRQRSDQKGEISPVSFKRKLRDLIEDKDGPVWKKNEKDASLNQDEFFILESRGRDRGEIKKLLEKNPDAFKNKYWDARIFGNTFLEEGASTSIKTGVIQFGLGISVAPVRIERMTTTNKSGVEEGKDRGMAPLGYRIVEHGVYCMPFFVNPTAAIKTGCTKKDIDLLLRVIPHTYKHTASYIRSNVDIIHAWYIEHKSPLGSCSDFDLIAALTPKKNNKPEEPSTSRADYTPIPTEQNVPEELRKKVLPIRDLMKEI
jgi:Cas7 group CRISPR-associated protein Csh2